MPGVSRIGAGEFVCAVCGVYGTKQCSGCKAVRYCSAKCQSQHWNSGHKRTCKDTQHGRKASGFGGSSFTRIALVPASSKTLKQIKKILFPYDEFVKFFNSDNLGFPPRGLFNCGNSCFANVVLQCLRHTRPLVAYLMEKGHRQRCSRNDWCFLCEFQTHLERAVTTAHPFSPISIFSQLPNIGGNLGYGNQEDAHEFMRLAIDTMQSLCLDEFGGENAIHPSSQETTLIQHIFGGHLQSQVICTNCNMISNQYENMMDLTVEIQGNCSSLEECLEQYTLREYLHGDNMYKCDGCNDYVKAWKRLSVRQAPNIVTIALKRFETGRFGKLNKRVTFPERLDLGPYMTRPGNGTDIYKLYAVVVHVDMLNASFFGHYICYVKDFRGYWFRVDDSKVVEVDLEDVLSQGAYMLLYSRLNARPSCLEPIEALKKDEPRIVDIVQEIASFNKPDGFGANEKLHDYIGQGHPTDNNSHIPVSHFDEKLRLGSLTEGVRDVEMTDTGLNSGSPRESQLCSSGHFNSRKNDASLTETSTSYIYDDDDDKSSHLFATEDVLQNWSDISMATHNDLCNKAKLCDVFFLKSSTLSSNDFLLSYSEEREQQICEEGLQEPSCPEDNTTKKSTWDDSTSKPVYSPVLPGMDSRLMSRKRNVNSLLESGELYLDNSADTASPKQKMDDKKIQ